MARLFLAALLPGQAQDALREAGERLKADYPAARLTRPENLHLTLLFLGETGERDQARLMAFLAARPPLKAKALLARPDGLGLFAGPQGTVFWAGVSVRPALAAFRDNLFAGLAGLGFAPDSKPFVPHITLARMKGQARGGCLPSWSLAGDGFAFSGISLMQSSLWPEGPVYRSLMGYPLEEGRDNA